MFFWSHRVTLVFGAYFFFCEKFTSCSSGNWDRSFFWSRLDTKLRSPSLHWPPPFLSELKFSIWNHALSRWKGLEIQCWVGYDPWAWDLLVCHATDSHVHFWSASRREPRNPKCQYIPTGLIYTNCDDINFIAWKIIKRKF